DLVLLERPGQRAPGADELVLHPLLADLVREPLVRVEVVVAEVPEQRAVELPAAALRDHAHRARALALFGPAVRLTHRELLHHLGVRVVGGRAGAAGVGAGRAVDRDVGRRGGRSVGREVPDRALVVAAAALGPALAVDADDLAREPGVVLDAPR